VAEHASEDQVSGVEIELDRVTKRYSGTREPAVDDFSMVVPAGKITIGGEDALKLDVDTLRRRIGYAIQQAGLFPHFTVAQNIAVVPGLLGWDKKKVNDRVEEMMDLVGLDPADFRDRFPRQLSGGQQQRIALARAIVFRPRLLLMDEPLGALDKKLREALQLEILRISRQLGATVIYVTHDQEEALVMSDRIAIFDKGRIQQLGTGEDLYERPRSVFVADFVGESNLLRGRLERASGGWELVRGSWRWRVEPGTDGQDALQDGGAAALVVRPEHLRVVAADAPPDGRNAVQAAVTEVLYLGPTRKIELALPDGVQAVVRENAGAAGDWRPGDRVRLEWDVERGVVVPDPASEASTASAASATASAPAEPDDPLA
jgi:ABC-type Fe3+/spermidine/putrescine transport system ATPase subunit